MQLANSRDNRRMVEVLVLLLIAYLLGSLSGSLLLGKLRGVDIRTVGSGNAGGTNALRTQGLGFALATVLVDVGKGALAAWLGWRFLPSEQHPAWLYACVLAAAAGHVWAVFHGFRGGKGQVYHGGTHAPSLMTPSTTAHTSSSPHRWPSPHWPARSRPETAGSRPRTP